MLLSHTSKFEGLILSFWIRYICVAQTKFKNQEFKNLYHRVKNIICADQWLNNSLTSVICSILQIAGRSGGKQWSNCLETVFPVIKLTQNCYLHYNINIFFLKTDSLILHWLLLSYTHVVLRHILTIWQSIKAKDPNFPSLFSELRKKCNLG